jgi:MFS family permease
MTSTSKPARKRKTVRALRAVYIANLLFAFHSFLIVYINSSYLEKFFTNTELSFLYISGAIINILLFLNISKLIKTYGSYNLLICFTVLELASIIGFAFSQSVFLIALGFILYQAVIMIILFFLDIFLESTSTDESRTGSIRSVFLTLANFALVISPAIVSFMLEDKSFGKVYILSSVFLIPFLIVLRTQFKNFKDSTKIHTNILDTLKNLPRKKDLYNIIIAHFILEFFYVWMVIYMPLYLYEQIGFTWQEIGAIFTIMLLPFIIFEIPAGKISDTKLGEKELLVFGFLICGVSTFLIPFLTLPLFFLWALVLFLTRVGASLIEITTESYFFKHVNENDPDIIGIFRAMRPLSYVIAPIVAIISFSLFKFQFIFFILAAILFFGIKFALAIKDTR